MNDTQLAVVLTTIQTPTQSVTELARRLSKNRGTLIIAGDKKGPASFDLGKVSEFLPEQLVFLNLDSQLQSQFRLAQHLPVNHYSRKNIGYLYAIEQGANCIYETDDDNAPLASWSIRNEYDDCKIIGTLRTDAQSGWINVYKHFSKANIWPRGLPLDQIHAPINVTEKVTNRWAPIQQGLANGSPDVDAIWRLVLDTEFTFDKNISVMVEPGHWCPFNTQSTWWWPAVYPLLYIPSNCSFRMCDIWKSFIAQRCLWELGTGVVFHAPEVYQERNPHNLMRDFSDEVVGYEQNDRIARLLADIELESGTESVDRNLQHCYRVLVDHGIFPKEEITLLEHWFRDLNKARQASDS